MQKDIAKKSRRVCAGIIDLLAAFALVAVLGVIFGDASISGSQTGSFHINFPLSGPSFYIGCIIVILGSACLEFKYGKTPGKYICKIQVVDESGSGSITPKQALIRNILRLVDGLFFYLLGYLIMAIDKNNQRLGDMVAKTLVVNNVKS